MRSGGRVSGNKQDTCSTTHFDGLGLSLSLHDQLQAAKKITDCKLVHSVKSLIFNFVIYICFFISVQLSSELCSNTHR